MYASRRFVPPPNATKLWITRAGKCLLANNNSHIPDRALRILAAIIEARSEDIISKWLETFGEVRFYC